MQISRTRRRRALPSAAASVGKAAGLLARATPAVAGILLLAYGLGQAYGPLSFIVLGVFLLIADRKIN